MKATTLCYAEGSSVIGMGHLYRVLGITQKYDQNIDFTFLATNELQKEFYGLHQCKYICLDRLDKILKKFQFGIYDSKEAECELFFKIKNKARNWIAIDSSESWVTEFDFLIYPSFYIGLEDVPKSIIKSKTSIRVGSEYVVLREDQEFIHNSLNWKTLVTFGGSDPNNLTEIAAKIIEKRKDFSEFMILLGPKFKNSKKYFEKKFPKLNFMEPIKNTRPLIARAQQVLTSLGTTLQECEYYDKKTLIISNQIFDKQDFLRISRSSSHPALFFFGGHFSQLKESSFNSLFDAMKSEPMKINASKKNWGSGWDTIFGLDQ